MIVFISDLHFVDETAGKHNVDCRAFELFTEDLAAFISRRKQITGLRVVLLGDVFDLLRTEYWFGVDPEQRPWAWPAPRAGDLEAHVQTMLDRVITKTKAQRSALREGLAAVPLSGGGRPRLVYLPGNHDRMVNLFASTRNQAREALGLAASPLRFPNRLADAEHGVLACHGHEFDPHNFGELGGYSRAAYDAVPIGDPITTELVSRLPGVVMEEVDRGVARLTPEERRKLRSNFQDLDNVRPLSSTAEWFLDQIRVFPVLEEAIERAVQRTVRDFEKLPYVKEWMKRNRRWSEPLNEAGKLYLFFVLFRRVKCLTLGKCLQRAARLRLKYLPQDRYAEQAGKIFRHMGPRYRFMIMGHTHDPAQTPVAKFFTKGEVVLVEQGYLNSGTWRRRQHRCLTGSGFSAWKDMTYVAVYKPGERGNKAPVFDTWSGRRI